MQETPSWYQTLKTQAQPEVLSSWRQFFRFTLGNCLQMRMFPRRHDLRRLCR